MTNFNEIEKLLTANNWTLIRVIGSHYQYQNNTTFKTIILSKSTEGGISSRILQNLELTTGLSFLR